MAGIIPDSPKLANTPARMRREKRMLCENYCEWESILRSDVLPARSGRKFGSENLSYSETMIDRTPSTSTTDK